MNKSIRHMPCKRFSCYSWHTESFLNKRWKHWCNNLTIFKTPIGNQDVVYWQNKPFLFTLLEFQRNNQGQAHIHGFVIKSRLGITPIKLNRVQKELISLSDFFHSYVKCLIDLWNVLKIQTKGPLARVKFLHSMCSLRINWICSGIFSIE